MTPTFERTKKAEDQLKDTLLDELRLKVSNSAKKYHKKLFERRPIKKQIVRKIAPPSYLLSVRRGVNHPQSKFYVETFE